MLLLTLPLLFRVFLFTCCVNYSFFEGLHSMTLRSLEPITINCANCTSGISMQNGARGKF